jgi:hypothetical protein
VDTSPPDEGAQPTRSADTTTNFRRIRVRP